MGMEVCGGMEYDGIIGQWRTESNREVPLVQ